MVNNKGLVPPQGGGAVGGAWQQNPPGELELIEKYQSEIKEAVVNAVKATRSCVLFYRDIYYGLKEIIDDEDTFRKVEGALWSVLDGLRLGDVTLYKIYSDPDESFHEVVVASIGKELTEEQLRVLKEVATLFGTDFYDRYSEAEGAFYDATPLFHSHREEVYTTLHNLVRLWTGCGGEQS
jgi:hypothetical protein